VGYLKERESGDPIINTKIAYGRKIRRKMK
jgi:hypothetical protein